MSLKLSALLLVFSICMCLGFTGHVAYADELSYDNLSAGAMIVQGSQYQSPNMDCISSKCVILVYDNSINRLKFFYSQDVFSTINLSLTVGSRAITDNFDSYNTYSLPYDIEHDSYGSFYFIYDNLLYKFNTSVDTAPNNTLSLTGYATNSLSCMKINVSGNEISCFDANYTAMFSWSLDEVVYYMNGTQKSRFQRVGGSWLGNGCGSASPSGTDLDVVGFYAGLDKYYVRGRLVAGGVTCNVFENTDVSLGSFIDPYDGLWQYINYKIYYRNVTKEYSESTTDWASFGSPVEMWNWTTEEIEFAHRFSSAGYDLVVFKLDSADPNDDGVYLYSNWIAPEYTPAVEYTSGTKIYSTSSWLAFLGFRSYSPKFDCQEDMQHCLMLVYDTGAYWSLFPAVVGLYSVNGFQSITSTFILPNTGVLSTEISNSYFNYANLPYDVKYNSVDDTYYLVVNDNTNSPKLYNWTSSAGLQLKGTFTQTCEQFANLYKVFGIAGRETSAPMVFSLCVGHGGVSPGLYGYDINVERFWLYNASYIDIISSTTNEFSCGGFCQTYYLAVGGFMGKNNEFSLLTRVYQVPQSGSPSTYYRALESSNVNTYFPNDYTGLQYWREGIDLVFTRTESGGVSAGQWKTLTDDFVSYTTPVLYYAWNLGNSETIPRTDRTVTSNYRIYGYEKTSSTDSGIFVYREPIMPIYVFARYVNPVTQQPDNPVTVNAQLTCPSGYTSTGIGSDVTLRTTCETAMNLQLLATGFLPTFGNITFDKISGCNSMFVRANYLPSSYSVNVTVRDQQTGSAIAGATVTMSGVGTFTTDSQGHASVTVQPVMSPYFVHSSDAGSCTETMQVSGTARSYWLQLSATGFRTSNYYNFKFVDETVLGGITYFTYKNSDALTLYLTKGADVEVRVYTFDGVPVEKNLVSVKASGATVYVLSEGVPVLVDTATQFPATFRLINDTPSYTATFNLTQGAYYEAKTLNIVNTTNYYSLSFTLPEESSYACNSVMDCTPSYCQGTFFYELNDCTGGQCTYDVTSCTLCDSEAGCYEQTSSTECFFDTDCIDTCFNPGFLNEGLCGSSNLCIYHTRECSNGCEEVVEGEDYCAEAPPSMECDQSTVVGMLSCMQSGMMSFIGSTYSPMFLIGLALFIMIIVITILALAFRGAQHVIR